MHISTRTLVSIATLVFLWTVIVFSTYTVVGAEEQPDVRIFDNPGAEEQPARGNFVPLEKFEGSAKLSNAYGSEGLSDFLNKLFLGAMSLGAILAVLRLAWAGFQYMASDLWANKQHAKEIIQETLLGLFILLGISLILNQINPDILKLNVGISKLPPAQQQTTGIPSTNRNDYVGLQDAFGSIQYPDAGAFGTPPAPMAPGEEASFTDATLIPPGSWCSQTGRYYSCTNDASSCFNINKTSCTRY